MGYTDNPELRAQAAQFAMLSAQAAQQQALAESPAAMFDGMIKRSLKENRRAAEKSRRPARTRAKRLRAKSGHAGA